MKTESLCAEGALAVRRFREGDLPELAALLADPEVMRWLEPPFDRARAAEFLRVAGLSEPPLIYAAEEDGAFLGYVIFHRYGGEDAAELGWVLRRSAWGRGYAGRLTALLLSALVLHEHPSVFGMAGAALILGATVLSDLLDRRQARRDP